jgi:hypothetical protein
VAIDMKTCFKCKKTLPFSSFFKHKGRKDGLQAYCKECKKAIDVKDYDKHRQERNEYMQRYRQANRAQFLTSLKKYREKNKDIRNAIQAQRRSAKLYRTPQWLTKEQNQEIKEFYTMAKELETVFPWKQHVDHIVPLLGKTVSGLHVPWNLQILSAKENITKGNR